MRIIILACICIASTACFGQTGQPYYYPIQSSYKWLGGAFDKELYVPSRDTSWKPTGPAFTFVPQVGYFKYNVVAGKWEAWGGTAGVITRTIDTTMAADGLTTQYIIPHQLGATPASAQFVSVNDLQGYTSLTYDSLNIYLNYSVAPYKSGGLHCILKVTK